MIYICDPKPDYDHDTHNLYPEYRIENGVFYTSWILQPKPDEDGYTPSLDEQPEGKPSLRERLDALEPTTDDLVEIIADQEYRLCLMELGITEEEVSE